MAAAGVTSTIQLPPDSTGKTLQTFENTVAGTVVEAQAIVPQNPQGDDATLKIMNTLNDILAELRCIRKLEQQRNGFIATEAPNAFDT